MVVEILDEVTVLRAVVTNIFFICKSCAHFNVLKPQFFCVCVSVGLSFKLMLSFCKDYILVHRAIPKSLRLEYLPSLLDFGPQDKSPRLDFLLVVTPTVLFTMFILVKSPIGLYSSRM